MTFPKGLDVFYLERFSSLVGKFKYCPRSSVYYLMSLYTFKVDKSSTNMEILDFRLCELPLSDGFSLVAELKHLYSMEP